MANTIHTKATRQRGRVVMEEEEEGREARIPRKCVWWSSVGMLFAISTVGLFLSLYLRSHSAQIRLSQQRKDAEANSTSLLRQNAELAFNYTDGQERYRKLQLDVKAAHYTIESMRETERNLTAELERTQMQLAQVTKTLWTTGIAGGLSVLLNAGLIPYAVAMSTRLDLARSLVEYLEPRYMQGLLQSMAHLLRKQEDKSTLQWTLLYSSGRQLNKEQLVGKVSNKVNTATFIITTAEEIIGFVLFNAWDFTAATIEDSRAFTMSFRKLAFTAKTPGPTIRNTLDFLYIGNQEILPHSISHTFYPPASL